MAPEAAEKMKCSEELHFRSVVFEVEFLQSSPCEYTYQTEVVFGENIADLSLKGRA